MKEVLILGVDLTEQVFQLHGAAGEGEAVFPKAVAQAVRCVYADASGVYRCNLGLRDSALLSAQVIDPRTSDMAHRN